MCSYNIISQLASDFFWGGGGGGGGLKRLWGGSFDGERLIFSNVKGY